MVESFRTEGKETIYAVMGNIKKRTDILKAVASYKKESLDRVRAKFKNIESGYVVLRRGELLLFEEDGDKLPAGAKKCIIVRR